MENPYDPQNHVKPEFFGGRKHILDKVQERISKAKEQKQSGGILVYGYRGVGKTSILKKIQSMVNSNQQQQLSNSLTIYRRLGKTTSDTELYEIITEDLLEELQQRKNLVDKLKELPSKASSMKVPILDIEFKKDERWDEKTPYHRLRSIVRGIKNAEYILIGIDDADYLAPEALSELKTIVEEGNETPIVLIVSGGFEFEEKLVADYSPVARVFSGASFNITEFRMEETAEALRNPLKQYKASWSDEGIKQVQKLSRGYPYLVQCLASAAYEEGKELGRKEVMGARETALEIGRGWLSHELSEASDNDILCFFKIVKLDKPTLKSSELSNAGVDPVYVGRLVKHKVLKKISRGRYDLIKPPIIAYYHILKRGLKKSLE